MSYTTLSVTQLSKYIKSTLEDNINLQNVYVCGEISNFKIHALSGTAYFSLKDNGAVIRCVMFQSALSKVRFNIDNGMSVLCNGKVSVYEKSGDYQLYVFGIRPEGVGELALSFEQLKEKLTNEGLFDINKKRPIPKYPERIAAVTSSTGAAIRDICNIIERRYPLCELTVCPTLVQGADAPKDIVKTLNYVYSLNRFDLIIVGRGGGSAEDLSCFNDESVVRAVASSPIPIISAVGHETDFTLSDFAADLRAPTPSAAAELAVPSIDELNKKILNLSNGINRALTAKCNELTFKLDALTEKSVLSSPEKLLEPYFERVNKATEEINVASDSLMKIKSDKLDMLLSKLDVLSPIKTLKRGYSVVSKNGNAVSSVNSITKDDVLTVKVSDGNFDCKVI